MASYHNLDEAPDINTSYPGHIFGFDPISQTCSVQLAIESLFVGHVEPYSLKTKQMLQGVPVQFIQGGGWSLTHPVPDGTPCYVFFAQRGISHWLAENKGEAGLIDGLPAPEFSQLFSHNSAVCVIGIQPNPVAIPGFNGAVFELRNADRGQRVTLNGDGSIEIISGKAVIKLTKDSEVSVSVETKATIKAPEIVLDGNTTVTKNFTTNGNADLKGTTKVGGVTVNQHVHANPEGGKVGPME